MITIKARKNDGSWITGLENYLAGSNLGAIKNLVELQLHSFRLSSVSLYFYNVGDYVSNIFEILIVTDKIEVIIQKNDDNIFAGFVDNTSIVKDPKELILSFNLYSYRYNASLFNGENIYDRDYIVPDYENILQYPAVYEDRFPNGNKIWYRFISINNIVNKIYHELNVHDKEVDYYSHIYTPNKALSFRDKNKVNFPNYQHVNNICADPDDRRKFGIFVRGGYYKGNFDEGFKLVSNSWNTTPDAEIVDWINQGQTTVNQVFEKSKPINEYDISWQLGDASYANNNALAIGVYRYGDNPYRSVYSSIRSYSGGSWSAWSAEILEHTNFNSNVKLPFRPVWHDGRTGKTYAIFRLANGTVRITRFDSSMVKDRAWSYVGLMDSMDENGLFYGDVKLINIGGSSYLFMLRWDNQELIHFDPTSEQVGRVLLNDDTYFELGGWWNLESLTYADGKFYSWILKNDKSIALFEGLPYDRMNFKEIGVVYQLDWGQQEYEDPDNWNPVEIGFRGWESYMYPSDWMSRTMRGFYNTGRGVGITGLKGIKSFANRFSGDLLTAFNLNRFANNAQFTTYSNVGEPLIINANFEDQNLSDVLHDLAKASRSVEWIDNNNKAYFKDRQNLMPNIHHFNPGSNITKSYAYITHEDQENFDFDANDSFTIECWANLNILPHPGEKAYIVIKAQLGLFPFYRLAADDNGYIYWNIHDGINQVVKTSVANVYNSQSPYGNYIALVIDRVNNTGRLWFNEGWADSASNISLVGSLENIGDFLIGRYVVGGGTSQYWNGFIREARITKKVMSEEELLNNYNNVNGWVTEQLTVGHWNFNEENFKDLSQYQNFLRGTGVPSNRFIKSKLYKLESIDSYLISKQTQYIWKNYFDGINVSYLNSSEPVKIGNIDPGKNVLSLDLPYIYYEEHARSIGIAYYNFFNTARNKLEVELINFYPKLFNFYKLGKYPNAKNYLCINTTHYHNDLKSSATLIEIEDA